MNFPRTYFEFEDVRPGEEEGQGILGKIFISIAGGILIPMELNQNILQFLTEKELLRFEMVSKTAEMVVKHCHALLYDAIHERIGELLVELNIGQSRRQVNEQKFKVGNRVRIYGGGGVCEGYPKICVLRS